MKVVGIIAEYNPMHNGHLYHIAKTREITQADCVIAVVSGNFVQRGDLSFIEKYSKATLALQHGIDLVVELPYFYSTQSAEIFSLGALMMLSHLGVSEIVFGSEVGTNETLYTAAHYVLDNAKSMDAEISEGMQTGVSYPNVMAAIFKRRGIALDLTPNNILALEYVKCIILNNMPIVATAILRKQSGYFSDTVTSDIASASYIRKCYFKQTFSLVKHCVPKGVAQTILQSKKQSLEALYSMFWYRFVYSQHDLQAVQDMEVGLDNRIIHSLKESQNFSDFMDRVKTKRYTTARIQRVILHALLDISKADTAQLKASVPFIPILGSTEIGRKQLKAIKKTCTVPLISSGKNISKKLSPDHHNFYQKMMNADRVYDMICEENTRKAAIIL